MFKYILKWYDYHATRRMLKRGNNIVEAIKLPFDSGYITINNNINRAVIDMCFKYNLKLDYNYKIGTVNDDWLKLLVTIRIELFIKK